VKTYSYHLGWSNEDQGYIATSAEFPGLSAFGESPERALSELRQAIVGAVETLEEDGIETPVHHVRQVFSGQFRLRLPRSLHASLSERAESEGVSLNTLVLSYVSVGIGARSADQFLSGECVEMLGNIRAGTRELKAGADTFRSICDASRGLFENLVNKQVEPATARWDRVKSARPQPAATSPRASTEDRLAA
jgi:predicted RNase H-like HicB family nuclease